MSKLKLTIGTKIFLGFAILIFIFVINSLVSYFSLNQSNSIIRRNADWVNPSVAAVDDLILMVTQARMLATNWVYLPRNDNDKKNLRNLHETQYPQLRQTLTRLRQQWNPQDNQVLDTAFARFERILSTQQNLIIKPLVTFDNYEDAMIRFPAEDAIEKFIVPQSDALIKILEGLTASKKAEARQGAAAVDKSFESIRTTNLGLLLLMLLLSAVMVTASVRSVTRPVRQMQGRITELSLGKLPETDHIKQTNDEIGEMAVALDKLIAGLNSTSGFAENIGKGNYDATFEPLSEEDILGNALLNMRQNLKQVAEEEKTRAWATEGLAKFGDILRSHTDDTVRLADQLITELVKYTDSNQGAVFLLEEPDYEDPYLTLTACYAWDRKKYFHQKIEPGDGLIGQAWQERDVLYLTDVPQDFITITSGLGEANPTNVLIVPLVFNDKVQGVLEIASFQLYDPHEIEFVKRISENIASTVSTVKTNEKTKQLLSQSQQMTEEMQAQEEEMRQNMEELEATQEEMRRNEQKYIDEIDELRHKLRQYNVSKN